MAEQRATSGSSTQTAGPIKGGNGADTVALDALHKIDAGPA